MSEPRVTFSPQIPGIRVLSPDAFARAICYAVYGDGSGCCGADHEVLCGSEECVGLMVASIQSLGEQLDAAPSVEFALAVERDRKQMERQRDWLAARWTSVLKNGWGDITGFRFGFYDDDWPGAEIPAARIAAAKEATDE